VLKYFGKRFRIIILNVINNTIVNLIIFLRKLDKFIII
jgi:hypothetical protein